MNVQEYMYIYLNKYKDICICVPHSPLKSANRNVFSTFDQGAEETADRSLMLVKTAELYYTFLYGFCRKGLSETVCPAVELFEEYYGEYEAETAADQAA